MNPTDVLESAVRTVAIITAVWAIASALNIHPDFAAHNLTQFYVTIGLWYFWGRVYGRLVR